MKFLLDGEVCVLTLNDELAVFPCRMDLARLPRGELREEQRYKYRENPEGDDQVFLHRGMLRSRRERAIGEPRVMLEVKQRNRCPIHPERDTPVNPFGSHAAESREHGLSVVPRPLGW